MIIKKYKKITDYTHTKENGLETPPRFKMASSSALVAQPVKYLGISSPTLGPPPSRPL